MKAVSAVRVAIAVIMLCAPLAFAHADTLTAPSCDQLYSLPASTISTASSLQYLNPTTCAAYQDLITRYNYVANNCSSTGLANPKVDGITSLNPTFALNLDNMLKAADAADGGRITINSAYRTVAGEECANKLTTNPSASLHTKGLAADLQYPSNGYVTTECDGLFASPKATYNWINKNDATYHLIQYDQQYSHLAGECNHVQAVSGSTGPGAAPTVPGLTSQNGIYSSPGLGAPPTAGQIVTQNTQCQLSNGTSITIAAGTQYPAGCVGSGTSASSGLQASCIGNTIAYNLGGTITTGQVCQAGCLNGVCLATTCPAGSTLTNGTCTQQQCPTGYTLYNGLCNQNQTQQQTAQQPTTAQPTTQQSSGTSNPTTGATTQASGSTGTTGTGSSAATTPVTSQISPVSAATLTTPTLVANLGTSTTPVTTPITLGAAAQNISQISAPASPDITYAQPTSALFANGQSGNGNGGTDSSGFTTTNGSGYDLSGGSDTGNSGAIAQTQSPTELGTNTFTSNDVQASDTQSSFANAAPSGFASDALSILAGLKNELLGALSFLSNYLHPATASQQTQQGSE